MRTAMILALMLILLASTAYAKASPGSVGLDIIGSKTDNIQIFSPSGESSPAEGSVDLEIIGSTANNTQIFSPKVNATKDYRCRDYCCTPSTWNDYNRPLCYPWSSYISARYDGCCWNPDTCSDHFRHLGVDAWYGCYWYNPTFMPKWPQN